MTTDTNTTADTHRLTAEELQALTEEMNAWMEATGRKRFPQAKQDELLEMGAKRCSRCKEVRRVTEFSRDRDNRTGYNGTCRECGKKKAEIWTPIGGTGEPAPDDLTKWSNEIREWLRTYGRKRIPAEMRAALAARGTKYCHKCSTLRTMEQFSEASDKGDGKVGNCKLCVSGYGTAWHRENRDLRLEQQAEYREANRERIRESNRAYREANYRTHPTMRLNEQLWSGKRRTLEAGGVIEDFDAADLLEFWEQHGIPADRDYFTDEPLDLATRSIDHLWAVSEGGPHARWALVPTAPLTNRMKRTMSPSQFRAWLRSEGIEPAERPDPTPFLVEALADRAAAQDPEELPELVRKAMETSVPARAQRAVVVQLEEGADHE